VKPARRWLVAAGLVLAAVAPFAGSPFAAERGRINVPELARQVEHEQDHVTALQLAQWIRARRPRLRILDVRDPVEYDSLHIPGATLVTLDSLADQDLRPDETIVLYSAGGAHAAQAWVFLRALGFHNVYFLRGGIYEWVDEVLLPTLPVDPTAAERQAFSRASELSRYFGGLPRTGVPRAERARSLAQLRRRGC
jgi:rhodanese-related sulfurtransferase